MDSPNVMENGGVQSTTAIRKADNKVLFLRAWRSPFWALKEKPHVKEIDTHESQSTFTKLEDYPLGYPRVSAFLDSEDSFMIYRRYGWLYSRVLLHKQDEIRVLKMELNELDRKDFSGTDRTRRCLVSRVKDEARTDEGKGTRSELLLRIEGALHKYGELLLQAQQLVTMNKPSTQDLDAVWTWFKNKPPDADTRPLLEVDESFIYMKDDLITFSSGRESARMDAIIDKNSL